jgi:hypothetical protein
MSISIEVSPCCGDSVEKIAAQMIALAKRLEIQVTCTCDEIFLLADKNSELDDLVYIYKESIKVRFPY